MGVAFVCIWAAKKIFFEICNKDSNPHVKIQCEVCKNVSSLKYIGRHTVFTAVKMLSVIKGPDDVTRELVHDLSALHRISVVFFVNFKGYVL